MVFSKPLREKYQFRRRTMCLSLLINNEEGQVGSRQLPNKEIRVRFSPQIGVGILLRFSLSLSHTHTHTHTHTRDRLARWLSWTVCWLSSAVSFISSWLCCSESLALLLFSCCRRRPGLGALFHQGVSLSLAWLASFFFILQTS